MNAVVEIKTANTNCEACNQAAKCLANYLSGPASDRYFGVTKRHRIVHRDEHLFLQDDPLSCVYLVRSGSFKTFALDADGREQVLGFCLPGDMMGLDGAGHGDHHSSVVALETASVCEINFAQLEAIAAQVPEVASQLNKMFGLQISRGHAQVRLLGRRHAEQRLSGFLLDLSERLVSCGYAAHEFNLSMSRHDIGDYLGLALETVSRLLGRMQKQGVLRVNRRRVVVLDPVQLARMAGLESKSSNSSARRSVG